MKKTITVFIAIGGICLSISAAQAEPVQRTTSTQISTDTQAPGTRPFDWSNAFPMSKDNPSLHVEIPYVASGNIEIKRSSEHHFNLMKRLSEVDVSLHAYYDGLYAGRPGDQLVRLRNNVMRELGRVVTLMDGYAKHYQEDISPYMLKLQESVKRYQP